ncbi:MAG: WGxxGxxG family protein [Waterburya sp.]
MNLTKLTTTSFLALSLALPAGAALSQDKTLNTNPNQTEVKIAQTAEDAGRSVDQAAESAQQETSQAANSVEDRADWGWLGLLGLLGLIGLAGKKRKDTVVEHRGVDPRDTVDRPTTYNR